MLENRYRLDWLYSFFKGAVFQCSAEFHSCTDYKPGNFHQLLTYHYKKFHPKQTFYLSNFTQASHLILKVCLLILSHLFQRSFLRKPGRLLTTSTTTVMFYNRYFLSFTFFSIKTFVHNEKNILCA